MYIHVYDCMSIELFCGDHRNRIIARITRLNVRFNAFHSIRCITFKKITFIRQLFN